MVLGVYGLGRFGSYWAQQLAPHLDVIAWSRNPAHPSPKGVRKTSEEELLRADVVVLCVAISALEEVIENIAQKLAPGTLVMDTCSVKMYPAEIMNRVLPPSIHTLATHPMFGPDSGQNGLEGLPIVFSPLRMPKNLADHWRHQFSSLGLKVLEMTPEQHDREAARTQGITHFIGRVLEQFELKESPIGTAGYHALCDIVRQTCNDPWKLFLDLQKYNPYTPAMRQDLSGAINTILEKFDSIKSSGRVNG